MSGGCVSSLNVCRDRLDALGSRQEINHIPERVHQGDFVLKLSEGVSHADQVLHDYEVTPKRVQCFDSALGFVRQALETENSKAA
jgi:hypothetical protein